MQKIALGLGAAVVGLIVVFLIFATVSGFSYNFHPFFSSCLNLSVGMTKEEVNRRMQAFLNDSDYKVATGAAGKYGWLGRLSYDDSLTIVLEKEPWYKLDQHPWQCEIHFKDGVVIDMAPVFD
jgi:hypothetical protein